MAEHAVVLRNAELRPGVLADLRIAGARIAAVAPRLTPDRQDVVVDLDGHAVLPGLVDHHVHLLALAAARRSVDCGLDHARSVDALIDVLRQARRDRGPGWLRGVGLDASMAGDVDRRALDRAGVGPIRLQDRTGTWWILNTAALAEVLPMSHRDWPEGVELDALGEPTGRLVRLDGWLRDRIPSDLEKVPDLAAVGADLAARGVTGVVDASATNGPQELALLAGANLPQRITAMTAEPGTAAPNGTGLDTGAPGSGAPGEVAVGAVKVLLDDTALPALDDLADRVAAAHRAARAVAVHCVTTAQLVLALTALAQAGRRPGDRIEHASVVTDAVLPLLVSARVTVVTQPGLVWSRGDRYLEEVDPDERAFLYRVGGLRRAGVPVAGSTDAPYGPADPWVAIQAAVERQTRAGRVIGPDEGVALTDAVNLFLGPPEDPARPRHVRPGGVADLCILDNGWEEMAGRPAGVTVRTTLVGGRPIHGQPW